MTKGHCFFVCRKSDSIIRCNHHARKQVPFRKCFCKYISWSKVGIIGRNGCGKSTLFAAIKGEIAPELGSLTVPRNFKISAVSQQTPSLDISALDYVKQGDKDLTELLAQKEKAYAENNGEKSP